mmetsp:Transcript_39898/g.104555  ORF Transcript_39898/g.104555 Transcript_39898/m.104555 type:complete len:282 (-) Transcript_39898:79-924(-)
MRIAPPLDGIHELLGLLRPGVCRDIHTNDLHEDHTDGPHLVHVLQRPVLDLLKHRPGDEPPRHLQLGREQAEGRAAVVLLTCDLHGGVGVEVGVQGHEAVELGPLLDGCSLLHRVLDMGPGLGRQHSLPAHSQRLRNGDLLQRRPGHHILIPPRRPQRRVQAPDLQHGDRAAPHANVQGQQHLRPVRFQHPGFEVVQALVDLQAAGGGAEDGELNGAVVLAVGGAAGEVHALVLDGRENDGEGVPGKLDGVSSVGVDQVDEWGEELVQTLGQELRSVALLG